MFRFALIGLLSFSALHLTACGSNEASESPPPGLSTGPRLPDTQNSTDDDYPTDSATAPDTCGFVHLPPYPAYTPISELFPNPQDLLTTPDTVSALARLRKIASPTPKYHSDLIQLVQASERLDKEHLLLLAHAAFFTSDDVDRIERDLKLDADNDHQDLCVRKATARRDLSLLKGYGDLTQMILNAGLPKIENLAWADALELLKEAMPTSDGSESFFYISKRFSPLNEGDLKTLMVFANRKRATNAAGQFALTWFTTFSDKSLQALLDLSALLDGRAKDALLIGAVDTFSSLSLEEVKALGKAAHGLSGEISGRAFTKIDSFSHQIVFDAMKDLEDQQRGEFLAMCIHQYPALTTAELRALLDSTKYRRSSIAQVAASKISDLSVEHITSILPLLSAVDHDEWLLTTSSRLNAVTSDEAIGLLHEAKISDASLSLLLLRKITDLTVANAVRIAGVLAAEDKDAFLLHAVDLVSDLNAQNLDALVKAGHGAHEQIRAKGEQRLNPA